MGYEILLSLQSLRYEQLWTFFYALFCLNGLVDFGSAGAEAIRALLMTGSEEKWSARAEALLFAAARADHVEKVIRPALARRIDGSVLPCAPVAVLLAPVRPPPVERGVRHGLGQ